MARRSETRLPEGRDEVRVCHVNLAKGYRGGERQTELLIRELARQGVTQRAIVRRDDELGRRLGDVPGLELRPIGKPFVLQAGLGRGWLLHAHESRAAHFAHACHWFTGARYLVTRRVDNRPSGSFLTRRLYRKAAAVVAISSAIGRILQQYEPMLVPRIIPSVQALLVSNPQATAQIRARWPGKFLVGHVGALDNSQKGQRYLIRAARRLATSHPQLQFVLLGDGKDEAVLKREAEGLANLSFDGYVKNVGDWLAAFDLFAFPSLHEGLGSVLLDAMSFGLPIVASRVDGIPDIVHDGDNGLLLPAADEAALAQAIARLADDPGLRERLGASGRRIAADYVPESMAQRYLALYREISPA
ncbi:MAG: glycosyltransferase family 4 protein [Nevskiales bacterium]